MRFRTIALLWLAPRAVPMLAAAAWVLLVPYPGELLEPGPSGRLLDRHGCEIDHIAGPDGTRSAWVRIDDLPPHVAEAFVAAEDRRFYRHPGVDPRAVIRAIWTRRGGASTITMQVVRLIEPRPRTWTSKLYESVLAIRLERRLSKRGILEQYLNRAPFGNRVTGIEAAAQLYFAKPARDLSVAEAAYLAALPHAPTRLNPYRSDRAVERQRWILKNMGVTTEEPLRLAPSGRARLARHLPRVAGRTTIDLELQLEVEGILRSHLDGLRRRQVGCGAVVVLDNATGEVLVLASDATWIDATAAPRSPGSTVKPFTYALAFSRGRSPSDRIRDEPVHFRTPTGDYAPRNYDGRHHGLVPMRVALGSSLNIPAVRLLNEIGYDRLHEVLRAMGWPLDQASDHYGLGLTLGDGETTLLSLTASYSALARDGEWIAPRLRPDGPARYVRIFPSDASRAVLEILSDDAARELGFGRHSLLELPFRAFVKTGTSADFRDNWCVGGTERHTVGVWVGNLDGSPMRGVTGITGAAPVWRDVILRLGGTGRPVRLRDLPADEPAREFEIVHPNDWDVFYLDPSRPAQFQSVPLRSTHPARWFVDGEPCDGAWRLRPGEHEVVAERDGITRRRRFRVE